MSKRLDSELVQRGIVPARERAKEAVKAGLVYVNGRKVLKPSATVGDADDIEFRGELMPYVGRGGLKLEKALQVFRVNLEGVTCLDLGASTGGFTDCMLQAGACRVFAVDVGHGQLVASLLDDPRVVNLEGVDAREVNAAMLGCTVQFASADVSFISLEKVLPVIANVLEEGSCAVCLVKPQFEAGRGHVGKKGVVRDAHVHERVLTDVVSTAGDCGLAFRGLDYSPVTGPEGNIEYLLHVVKSSVPVQHAALGEVILEVVSEAHGALSGQNGGK